METKELELLQYPIGRYVPQQAPSQEQVEQYIVAIGRLPDKLSAAVSALSSEQLDTPYRTGGWTVRQVVHHLADSHLNGYTRHRLALTEEKPVIRVYDQNSWANLPDSLLGAPEVSLDLLSALHRRWILLLKSLSPEQLDRTLIHPENGEQTIRQSIGGYAWHGNHHLAHITNLILRKGWASNPRIIPIIHR